MGKSLNIVEESCPAENEIKNRIIKSYRDFITRTYCSIRFNIIPLRFLETISQFLPEEGNVLDIGCGFGLFAIYFAMTHPQLNFIGIDLSPNRIQQANDCAKALGVKNVKFHVGDAHNLEQFALPKFNGVILIDLLHHIEIDHGNRMLKLISDTLLRENGVLVIKDVSTRPRLMLWFTFLMDWIMNPKDSFYYRSANCWKNEIKKFNFLNIHICDLWDILPYPHFLLVARK